MYDALLWLTIYFMVILGAEHANSTHGYTDYYFTLHFAIALCFGVSTYIPFIYIYLQLRYFVLPTGYNYGPVSTVPTSVCAQSQSFLVLSSLFL